MPTIAKPSIAVRKRLPLAAGLLCAVLCAAAGHAQQDLPVLEELAFQQAVARVAPSVVRIETFGGAERVGQLLVGTGPTTGVIVAEDGYILSSAFNFIQKPESILVTLPDGARKAAQIVARDNSRMLVLLKVSADAKLPTVEAVPRDEMAVGQWTIAVGRTYDQEAPNMSVGVLSAADRIWGKAIQTDAKISPNNYGGALIDIQGRVLGVLAPLSPQGEGEIAGAEWYDSGIGFAIPMADVLLHLDAMKAGNDIHPGLLGIALKGSDIYNDEALIAAVQPNSPAYEAGLKAGDKIVKIDEIDVERQAQLKHSLGRRYAGETVQLVIARGDEKFDASITLADHVDPYQHPFLGVLPLRGAGAEGVVVRYVYADSPAAKAGVQPGDVLTKFGDAEVADAANLREMVAAHDPKKPASIAVLRGSETLDFELDLGVLPTDIPAELPPAREPAETEAAAQPPRGEVKIKLPEEPNECFAYVPDSYRPQIPHGLVVWLHAPGKYDRQQLLTTWKSHCDEHDLILLAPRAADPNRWSATEAAVVRKLIDDVRGKYNLDPLRVVVHGHEAGGALAFLTALAHRDVVRGAAAVDAPLPLTAQPPFNDPLERLAIFAAYCDNSPMAARIAGGLEKLSEMKYPVTVRKTDQPRYLTNEEIAELVRWIDTLDRI